MKTYREGKVKENRSGRVKQAFLNLPATTRVEGTRKGNDKSCVWRRGRPEEAVASERGTRTPPTIGPVRDSQGNKYSNFSFLMCSGFLSGSTTGWASLEARGKQTSFHGRFPSAYWEIKKIGGWQGKLSGVANGKYSSRGYTEPYFILDIWFMLTESSM